MADMNLISWIAPYAQKLEASTGIPASVTMGQYILETGWGKSELGTKYNNPFGVKATDSWKGKVVYLPTTERVNGRTVVTTAPFRWYDSLDDALADRGKILSSDRYKSLLGKDAYTFAQGLEKAGYATDELYAEKLSGIIKGNDLTRFDKTPSGGLLGWYANMQHPDITPATPSASGGGSHLPTLNDLGLFGNIVRFVLLGIIIIVVIVAGFGVVGVNPINLTPLGKLKGMV